MLFNSLGYIFFLPIVFLLYWRLNRRNQNVLLLAASYFFYSCWDWRFLFLLIFSTLLDFFSGLKMQGKHKRFWFWTSIIINVGFLGVFKYYNFFAESFTQLISPVFKVNPGLISVILPVGISFYTFHGLSYVIDVYKERIEPERNFIDYAVFVSFFPLLVAGPIERATHLLPQIKKDRLFDYSQAVDGLRQILWGLFKKIVIADQCAIFVNQCFSNTNQAGGNLLLGAIFFSFQIYGDFSGYSDIALGSAKLFGIHLLRNFNYPYFSRDIAEFWRRWHISLSSWFRDYLYIPLGGSRHHPIRNVFIIFIVSGFWHGANWTFILWGLLNALFIIPSVIFKTHRNNLEIVAKGRTFPNIKELASILITFALTTFAWIFFRSDSIGFAFDYISSLSLHFTIVPKKLIGILSLFMIIEWRGREHQYAIQSLNFHPSVRKVIYYSAILTILYFCGHERQFIYFQF